MGSIIETIQAHGKKALRINDWFNTTYLKKNEAGTHWVGPDFKEEDKRWKGYFFPSVNIFVIIAVYVNSLL